MTNRPRKSRPSCHPFQPGQRVTIFRFGHFRRPFIEGSAHIVSPIHGTLDFYRVRFEGEQRVRERLAHPGDWQANPRQLLKQLIAEWHASLTPALLREFFPDEVRLEERAQ